MPLDHAELTHPTTATTSTPPMHATRDTRYGKHHTRAPTKNSRTNTPRSTNTSVSGRMLLSSEFQLTKNSHRSQSEARSTHKHAPTSSTQHAKHANAASQAANKHHFCTALQLLPACCHQHCIACELALQTPGHSNMVARIPRDSTIYTAGALCKQRW